MIDRTVVIAEAGVNHNGKLDIAFKLIEHAARSGADIIKFQTFRAESIVTAHTPLADYQKANASLSSTQLDLLTKLELPASGYDSLIECCRQNKITFLSTAFDIESLDFLQKLGLDRFKIPSGEITNLPYLRHVAGFRKPLILSTGMSTIGEIERALEALESFGAVRERITVLHCNTEYPTPMADVNLRAMCTIKSAFKISVGYSDHTLGIDVPIAAVALGAKIIEKHLTLDRTLPGPDHRASLEPGDFQSMVQSIRNIEVALGNGIKRPTQSEQKNILTARKSIVAKEHIKQGEMFTPSNITTKRSGYGLSAADWDWVIGRVAQREFSIDEPIDI